MAAVRTKWIGAVSQSDERDTVNAGERQTINSILKTLEDSGYTIMSIDSFKGGLLVVYSIP